MTFFERFLIGAAVDAENRIRDLKDHQAISLAIFWASLVWFTPNHKHVVFSG